MSIRQTGHNFWNYLFEKSIFISGLSFVGLTIVDISNLNNWQISVFGIEALQIGNIIYYFLVVLAIIFGIFTANNASELSKLEKDLEEKGTKIVDLESSLNQVVTETVELFNSYLNLLVKNLKFTHNDRISVYKVHEGKFCLIGRKSVNPTLESTGRQDYPVDEGLIGKGWAEGEFFIDNLPDPNRNSGNTYYNQVNQIKKIPRDVCNDIRMKSRTYFIYRINGYDNEPNSIIVMESMKDKAFKKEDAIEGLKGVKQSLIMFVQKYNTNHVNNGKLAENIGL
jgi:hypothetical protein